MYECGEETCLPFAYLHSKPSPMVCKSCRFLARTRKEEREEFTMTQFDRMIQLLDCSWHMRSQIVPCLVGPPGIGKTAAIEQHAKAHGCGKVVKIVASRCVPSETVGMTMPDHEHRSMDIYNSMQLSSLEDGDILFLDELLEADQYVLSTLLTVIESREMADGTPLPDIQIVAATNDTISPEQLKPNIRQRFMFQRYNVDREQTHDYILKTTGIDVVDGILEKLCDDGSDYNFLTPRSLTKLCMWIGEAPKDMTADVARVIDRMWSSRIGSELLAARRRRDEKLESPEAQVKKAVREMIESAQANDEGIFEDIPEDFDFQECTMSELLDMLQGLPEWEDIASRLSKLEIEEEENTEDYIAF